MKKKKKIKQHFATTSRHLTQKNLWFKYIGALFPYT